MNYRGRPDIDITVHFSTLLNSNLHYLLKEQAMQRGLSVKALLTIILHEWFAENSNHYWPAELPKEKGS